MRNALSIALAVGVAAPALANIMVTFEEPEYFTGSLDGQAGGGITWQEYEPDSDAWVSAPGFDSSRAGLWEVSPNGGDSDGDDMLGLFDNAQSAIFTVSAMTYVSLEPNRPNGTSRAGHFFVSDVDFIGTAMAFLENGNVGYWGGGGFFINDTGVAIQYEQWVPIEIQIDYDADTMEMYYDGVMVAADTLTGDGSYADQLDIWLDTVAIADNPNPGDYMLIDDIVITPAPGALALMGLGGFVAIRRRR